MERLWLMPEERTLDEKCYLVPQFISAEVSQSKEQKDRECLGATLGAHKMFGSLW